MVHRHTFGRLPRYVPRYYLARTETPLRQRWSSLGSPKPPPIRWQPGRWLGTAHRPQAATFPRRTLSGLDASCDTPWKHLARISFTDDANFPFKILCDSIFHLFCLLRMIQNHTRRDCLASTLPHPPSLSLSLRTLSALYTHFSLHSKLQVGPTRLLPARHPSSRGLLWGHIIGCALVSSNTFSSSSFFLPWSALLLYNNFPSPVTICMI
ncbi:hypothetical protein F4801DRAFT_385563 [Xylaria longipes]|nr:hypothetical protein F4801DRAFT_385563 [Xylaria longipes]